LILVKITVNLVGNDEGKMGEMKIKNLT